MRSRRTRVRNQKFRVGTSKRTFVLAKLVRVPEKRGQRPLRATPKYFEIQKKSHVYITQWIFKIYFELRAIRTQTTNFVSRGRVSDAHMDTT